MSSLSSKKSVGLFHVNITVPGFVVLAANEEGAEGTLACRACVAPSLRSALALCGVILYMLSSYSVAFIDTSQLAKKLRF